MQKLEQEVDDAKVAADEQQRIACTLSFQNLKLQQEKQDTQFAEGKAQEAATAARAAKSERRAKKSRSPKHKLRLAPPPRLTKADSPRPSTPEQRKGGDKEKKYKKDKKDAKDQGGGCFTEPEKKKDKEKEKLKKNKKDVKKGYEGKR